LMLALRYLALSAGSPARPNWQMNLGTCSGLGLGLGLGSEVRARGQVGLGSGSEVRVRGQVGFGLGSGLGLGLGLETSLGTTRKKRASSKKPSLGQG